MVMVHEKKLTKEKKAVKEHLPLKETKKCKSHVFKDVYEQVRQQKLVLHERCKKESVQLN